MIIGKSQKEIESSNEVLLKVKYIYFHSMKIILNNNNYRKQIGNCLIEQEK